MLRSQMLQYVLLLTFANFRLCLAGHKLISTSTTNSSSIVLELEEVVEEDESEEVTDTVSEVKSEQLDIVVAAFILISSKYQ